MPLLVVKTFANYVNIRGNVESLHEKNGFAERSKILA